MDNYKRFLCFLFVGGEERKRILMGFPCQMSKVSLQRPLEYGKTIERRFSFVVASLKRRKLKTVESHQDTLDYSTAREVNKDPPAKWHFK